MSEPRTGRSFIVRPRQRAFTLVELLVVIGIIGLLLSVILPSLNKARQQARKTACVSNLHQIGTTIHAYAHDYNDTIPFGPETGSFFYPIIGNVTSLISLGNGEPVGLGLLLESYLAEQPKVLFCPGADQPSMADQQLARVGRWEAQCDYYYRHASVAILSGTPDLSHIRLSRLGSNRNGHSIAALAMDVQFLAHSSLEVWGVFTRTSHRRRICNILFADGGVLSEDNTEDPYTIDIGNGIPQDALDKILQRFEQADQLR